jgi:choice-of-anchor A domain-containing protein
MISQKMVYKLLFAPVGAAIFLAVSTSSAIASLGLASGYNVFVFGNMNQTSDAQGKVAVGGNATFTNFGIGNVLANSNGATPHLVVGGNLTYNGGQVFGGSAIYGGTAQISNAGIPNGSFQQGTSIDFAAAKQYYTQLSASLGNLPANGTTTYHPWGGIQLDGGNDDFVVFDLDGAKLSSTNSLQINAKAGATVVVNITGTNITLKDFGIQLNGVSKQNVLYNFVNATNLTSTGFSFQGTVLAPFAHYQFDNGNLEGTLIAASVSGSGEFHNYTFGGTIPNGTPSTPTPPSVSTPPIVQPPTSDPKTVPEPTTLLGLGLVTALFGTVGSKRVKRVG